MITEFGKILRIIRINSGDSAKDMAEKLNISASYLSAIENGKRNIPNELMDLVFKLYPLSNKDKEKLKKAAVDSSASVKIDLTDLADKKKQVLIALTGNDLDESTIEQLCQIIKTNKKGNK